MFLVTSPTTPPLADGCPDRTDLTPLDPRRPLHTPEKIITSLVSQSPVSALPLHRVSKAPSTAIKPSTSTRKPSKPKPLRLTSTFPFSVFLFLSSQTQTPFAPAAKKPFPSTKNSLVLCHDEPSYAQPQYLPILPSHSFKKQRLVDDGFEDDVDARVVAARCGGESVEDDDALFFDDWKYTKGLQAAQYQYQMPSSPQLQPSLHLVRGTRHL
ncbi:hypothetical protein VKT23_013928 [Stygiomarasmius scandens]|uniref:Uncharacterized protein n=1 Tax=Marasmiellus scandens TaxID=2682957 RepID=A0ABR1J441_9AGAR